MSPEEEAAAPWLPPTPERQAEMNDAIARAEAEDDEPWLPPTEGEEPCPHYTERWGRVEAGDPESGPHASLIVCSRPECKLRAMGWVRRQTGLPGKIVADPREVTERWLPAAREIIDARIPASRIHQDAYNEGWAANQKMHEESRLIQREVWDEALKASHRSTRRWKIVATIISFLAIGVFGAGFAAYSNGYDDGYDKGITDGYIEGFLDGDQSDNGFTGGS